MLSYCIQVRLESIEAVNKILEEANKRIQPTGTGITQVCILSVLLGYVGPILL